MFRNCWPVDKKNYPLKLWKTGNTGHYQKSSQKFDKTCYENVKIVLNLAKNGIQKICWSRSATNWLIMIRILGWCFLFIHNVTFQKYSYRKQNPFVIFLGPKKWIPTSKRFPMDVFNTLLYSILNETFNITRIRTMISQFLVILVCSTQVPMDE